jgi:hypothetical protein
MPQTSNPKSTKESQPPKFGSLGLTPRDSVIPVVQAFDPPTRPKRPALSRTFGRSNSLQPMPMRPQFPLPKQEGKCKTQKS